MNPKIAIFASGNGSNFEAIVQAIYDKKLEAEIAVIVSDKAGCFALERAKNHGIDTFVFNAKDYNSKSEYEKTIVELLITKEVQLIVLAGYMRLVGDVLLTHFENRIINIHPALLPAFPGMHAIEKAYKYGVQVFGITIHYVDAGMDTGKIIAQDCFKISGDESLETIEEKIHQLEHQLYPKVIQHLLKEKI